MLDLAQVVAVLVRLAAVYIVVHVLGFIAQQGYWFSNKDQIDLVSFSVMMAFAFAPLVVAILLWRFPLFLARNIVSQTEQSKSPAETTSGGFEVAALSVVGVFILITNLSDLLYWFLYFRELENAGAGEKLGAGGYASIITTMVELVLGVVLIFGSRGIVGIITLARYAGAKK